MNPETKDLKTIDEYIALWNKDQQALLKQIRDCIRNVVPDAKETISYQMPAFKQGGVLMYFVMFKNHYSLFPGAEPIEYFSSELKSYETSKGTIKIPMDEPVPEKLITDLVLHNLERIQVKASVKKSKSKSE